MTILTLWQEVVEQCACTCVYIYIYEMCVYVYVSAWYGTMQRLQVLDSRESTNEHKTCQQPWEVGRVSAELLVRSMFALYRGSRCRSQGSLRPLTRKTALHESTSVNSCALQLARELQKLQKDAYPPHFSSVLELTFISLLLKIRRTRNNYLYLFSVNIVQRLYNVNIYTSKCK